MGTNLKERLNAAQLKELQLISSMMAKGEPSDSFNVVWEKFLKNLKNEMVNTSDISALIQGVLRESYLETNADLQYHAKKVNFFNEQKKQIRENLSRVRKIMQDYITCQEEILTTIGDDDQLANIDLQNALQKQQQTMQTMSNVSKNLHDTAMAVIRKIG